MGDCNTSKKSIQWKEKRASVTRCWAYCKGFLSPGHGGLLSGTAGLMPGCSLPSQGSFFSLQFHQPHTLLIQQFLFQSCSFNRISSLFIPIIFFFLPLIIFFPSPLYYFFPLSLFPLLSKMGRQEINISFVGLVNQCCVQCFHRDCPFHLP